MCSAELFCCTLTVSISCLCGLNPQSVTYFYTYLSDLSEVFVWGYGILGKGPRLDQCLLPEKIPSTLFGCNELNPDQTVIDIHAGSDYFAANTGKNCFHQKVNSCILCMHVVLYIQ